MRNMADIYTNKDGTQSDTITVRLKRPIWDSIDAIATATKRTKGGVLKIYIEEHIADIKKKFLE